MALKSVFIDVGNTLLYEKPSRAQIYAAAARAEGVEIAPEEMRRLMRRFHDELPRELDGAFRYSDPWFAAYITEIFQGALGIPSERLGSIRERLFARFSDPATFRFFPGAIELLEALRRSGLSIGIVSNWSSRLPVLLERLGIAGRVDFILCSALEGCEKPEPEIFRRALARAGARPSEALHAGDHPEKDLHGPRAVGIQAVLVDHEQRHAELDAPRVGSLAELARHVEERLA